MTAKIAGVIIKNIGLLSGHKISSWLGRLKLRSVIQALVMIERY
jgi:hypothetical protein